MCCFEEKYPDKLLKIREYPQELYYRGNVNLLNSEKIIAIVGSRECSEYGRKYARLFARALAKEGVTIISGLAIGIDTAAHYGSVYEKGSTIAVLGGGLNRIYPKENLWLYNEIINNNGCVITEHEDNDETIVANFPKRNRIISGIADAVLVIEAKHRSGSKITARYAIEQGKKVYCIPHNLDDVNGVGINELILDGAKMITSIGQILKDLYGEIKTKEVIEQKCIVPGKYQKIYNLLKEKELSVDEVSKKINESISATSAILTIMEIEGYIERNAGNTFKIKGAK
ncbi:MAG: DNA-processing protein DprA [Christensenellales bacterium]